LNFQDAQLRLLAYVRERIHNGDFTERGLARSIGISQPHAHNVLKGARKLSPKIHDSILRLLHITLVDLASLQEVEDNLRKRRAQRREQSLPFLSGPLGPGTPWPGSLNPTDRYPLDLAAATTIEGLVMARLAPDALMQRTFGGADIAMVNISQRARSEITAQGLYVIESRGESPLRYLRAGAMHQYLVSDAVMNQPLSWERLRMSRAELVDWVRGRVVWLGKEENRDLPADQRGRFLAAISS